MMKELMKHPREHGRKPAFICFTVLLNISSGGFFFFSKLLAARLSSVLWEVLLSYGVLQISLSCVRLSYIEHQCKSKLTWYKQETCNQVIVQMLIRLSLSPACFNHMTVNSFSVSVRVITDDKPCLCIIPLLRISLDFDADSSVSI